MLRIDLDMLRDFIRAMWDSGVHSWGSLDSGGIEGRVILTGGRIYRNGGHAVWMLMAILDEVFSVLWRYGMAVDVDSLHLSPGLEIEVLDFLEGC